MNEVLLYIVAAVTAFLFSGVNPAIILSKLIYHEDIREKGSHNPGFTNFKRVYGSRYAWFVFALDILKCVIFCAIFGALFDKYYGTYQLGVAFTGFFAMLGHCFPVWYHMKGGKGFLVFVGMIWMIDWHVGLAATAVFLLVLFTTKYMSVASMSLAVSAPIFLLIAGAESNMVIFLVSLGAVLLIFRHKANIIRLKNHTESRFSVRSGKKETGA